MILTAKSFAPLEIQERFKHIQLVSDDIKKLQEETTIYDTKKQVDEQPLSHLRDLIAIMQEEKKKENAEMSRNQRKNLKKSF